MGRLLVLVVLVVFAVWLIRRALRASTRNPDSSSNKTEELVRCANCGVLLPRAEARLAGGALYCTEEHARLGPGPR
jgi:uncharacterized protein